MFPQDVKIVDVMRTNLMMLDIILEENDRLVVCGSVNMMDHENNNLAFMAQMTPAIMKKMSTLFQVTFTESPLAINYPWHCYIFNPLNPELNPIYLLALLGSHHFLHVSRIRVKLLTLRRLMSYIYGEPILDVSRSHTTTQHSR